MKYALVTGANSDVGKSICEKLLEQNYEVIACCHLSASNLKDLNVTIKYCDFNKPKPQLKQKNPSFLLGFPYGADVRGRTYNTNKYSR